MFKAEKSNVGGIIVKTGKTHVGRGYYKQVLYYTYSINDSTYSARMETGKRYGLRNEGDSVKVEYEIAQPEKSEIIAFYKK